MSDQNRDNFFIKQPYTPRVTPEYFYDDLSDKAGITYQPDVYPFAAFLAQKFGCTHVIDIGCGSAQKLIKLYPQFEIVGIDVGANYQTCRTRYDVGTWRELNLDQPGIIPMSEALLKHAILICSDVIEHLVNPSYLLENLRSWLNLAPLCVLSTPERDLARGLNDPGPPANLAHVREWNLGELEMLLRSYGLNVAFTGLTLNNDQDYKKETILAVIESNASLSLTDANSVTRTEKVPDDFNVVAIMTAYNEEDIIVPSIKHLIDQGISVYLIDNWSTDSTAELAERYLGRGLLKIEKFPKEGPAPYYNWEELLARVGNLTKEIEADWFIHHDADEIRASPWSELNLRQGIYRVDRAGYNCIDHTVITFHPTDNNFVPGSNFEAHFKHFDFGTHPAYFSQLKAWKNWGQSVSLTESGGHEARFEGRRVYPYKFLLKHYPIRSQEHGQKKVLRERKARWNPEERAKGWHTHYDEIDADHSFLHSPLQLLVFEEHHFNTTYLTERLSGVGIVRSNG